jgi:hypothetical protein
MGAGKGKTKRTQTQPRNPPETPPANQYSPARESTSAWNKFVKDHNLQNQTFKNYYQIQTDPNDGSINLDETLKLTNELFHDYIITGALTLPTNHHIEEYELQILPYTNTTHLLALKNTKDNRTTTVISNINHWFTAKNKMNSYDAEVCLRRLATAINKLTD